MNRGISNINRSISGMKQRGSWALLALSTFMLFGYRSETIAPYSEATELKFRTDYVKDDLKDPTGGLAFLKAIEFTDDKAVFTFGSGTENTIVLGNWGPEPLKLQRQGDNIVILSSPRDATLEEKPAAAGMSLPAKSGHWIKRKSVAIRINPERERRIRVQVFDSKSAPLQELHALNWYLPTAQHRLAAEWIPLPAGHTMVMQRTNGGSDVQAQAAGYVEFTNAGRPMRLYAQIVPDLGLHIVFRDLTSRSDTYQSGRFLDVPFSSSAFDPTHKFDPAKKAKMALDFNQATNPPCAYNPNTKCPIAPPENRLPFAIPAGEKRYHQ